MEMTKSEVNKTVAAASDANRLRAAFSPRTTLLMVSII
jgi:hypothetical protein